MREYNAAFITTAQYLAGLTVSQDLWSETGKMLVNFFGADLCTVAEGKQQGEFSLNNVILAKHITTWEEQQHECRTAISEVLESGFLSTRSFAAPDPLAVVFLPVTQENRVIAVILVGHSVAGSLPKELLNIYLAIAGLLGTTVSRLVAEKELRGHRRHLEQLVQQRTIELTAANEQLRLENIEHARAEEQIQQQVAVLNAINSIFQVAITAATLEVLGASCLAVAEDITGSSFGFVGEVGPDGLFHAIAISNSGWDACAVLDRSGERRPPEGFKIHGIYGRVLQDGKGFFTNDPANHPDGIGLPHGHPPLVSFLGVPFVRGGNSYGMIAVGNRAGGYSQKELEALEILSPVVAEVFLRKKAEDKRLSLEKQLLHAQKLESLGVLAGGIAHDFNNLLTSIVGNADLALMRVAAQSPVTENLLRIEQAAERAADLTKQMLAYSGKGKFIVEQHDLNLLLEEMLHMLEVSISKKALLELNLTRPLPRVEADATQLRQIIMNLVINASEAIGDSSGIIAATTGCMMCDRIYLDAFCPDEIMPEGRYVSLEISDSGCGMSKETLSKLFDPFFTTKFTGRGLGMSAVLGIVRGHKGAIHVYSEVDKGTTFKILLPATADSSDLFEVLDITSTTDDWHGSGTVLIVDDEDTVRYIGVEMLEELGFTAITANDGSQALEIYRSTPDIAFVILDLTMPNMDGEQCLYELQKLNPDVKIIMSSGYNQHEVSHQFSGKGVAGFIQKPYRLAGLIEVIKCVNSLIS